jgi:UrcA family protein
MSTSRHQKFGYGVITFLFTAFTLGVSPAVHAHDLLGPDIAVRYGDLEIDSEQGATQLLKRIDWAASRVCSRLHRGNLTSLANVKACHEKLMVVAVAEVNHPMLFAAYNSSRGDARTAARLIR